MNNFSQSFFQNLLVLIHQYLFSIGVINPNADTSEIDWLLSHYKEAMLLGVQYSEEYAMYHEFWLDTHDELDDPEEAFKEEHKDVLWFDFTESITDPVVLTDYDLFDVIPADKVVTSFRYKEYVNKYEKYVERAQRFVDICHL